MQWYKESKSNNERQLGNGRRLNARNKAKHSGEGEGDVKMETDCGMRRKGSGPRRGKKNDKAGTRESGSAALGNDVVAM